MIPNVALPDIQLPLATFKAAQANLHFAPLNLNFTVQTPAPEADCTATSDVGTLPVSIQASLGGVTYDVPIGLSIGSATVSLVGGPNPHLDWSTSGFFIKSLPPAPPVVFFTGPINDSVSLATLGLSYPDTPFETILRVGEAFFHHDLSNKLFGVLTNHVHIEDPGSTNLLLTGPSGEQTGMTPSGAIVNAIPFSAYFPSFPMIIVAAPVLGAYQLDVQGRAEGGFQLVTGLVVQRGFR